MAGDGVITVSPEEVEGHSDTITVSPEELNAPAQASPDVGNQELAKYGLSANPNPSSHPDLEPVSRIPTPANIPSGAPIAPGSYDTGPIAPMTATDREPVLKPEEHPILNAVARTGAEIEREATLGILNPEKGTVGLPFGSKQQVAPPIAEHAPYDVNLKLVPPPVGPLPNSPETPAIPVSVSVPGVAEGAAGLIGSAVPFGPISRTADAALGGILDRLGMRTAATTALAPPSNVTAPVLSVAQNTVEDAVNKMLQLETARRIAAQAVAGGVVGGAQPTGPGESHLENAAAGAGVGAAAGGASEMLGAVANAVRDANLQGHFKTILDAEKAVSDFLLAKKEITDPNGNKITINSREEADRLAQELLKHAGRVSDAKDIKEFAKQAKEFGKQAQSATKEVTRQAEAKAQAEQTPGRGGPRKPPPAEAAGTAPKPAEPNPPAPTSDGAAVPQHETVTVQPHELEGGLEGAPDQQIRPQGGVKPEAESIEAETGRIVKGAKVTVNVDGQPTQGVVQWIGAGEKSNVARVKVEGNRTVSRPIDQLKIVPKGELTAGPEEITVPKQELEQESAIEQARRGAGERPAEELPVNRVPLEQRPSTTIPQEENANMAARLDKRNLQPGEQNAVGKGIDETGDSSERQRVSPQREKAEAGSGNSLGQRETSSVAGEHPTAKTEEVEPKYEFGSTQINVPKESPLYKEHQKAAAQIATEDLAPNGREENPHVTVRYGLKDTSPEQAAKITAAVKDTKPFWVSLGETKSFPAGKDGVPLFSEVQKTPELENLRKTVEGAGDFKADDHGEYKPHVTLGYVKPGTEDKYVGKKGLKGQTVLVDHIAITKQDGSQEVVKLQGAKIPENLVRKGGRGESPEPLSGHGAQNTEGRAPGNEEIPSERNSGRSQALGVPLPSPVDRRATTPEPTHPHPLIKEEATKEPEPGTVGSLPVSSIKADPQRFQFKLATDAKGTSAKLKEVEAFKPHLAGTVSVWKDPADGHFYVT
jgi:2'-5' RNA ligase